MALTPDTDQFSQFLRLAFLRSPNFLTGVAGWTINQDGSAEFNNVTIRGGTVISGINLFYSGPPAFGNLVASISATSGTDPHGNAYLAGIASYSLTGLGGVLFAISANAGALTVFTASSAAGPWTQGMTLQPTLLPGFGSIQAWQTLAPSLIYGSVSNPLAAAHYPPSGDTSGITDTHYISELIKATGSVRLLSGTYYVNCGDPILTTLGIGQYIRCDSGVFIKALGSGDLFGWSFSGTYNGKTTIRGGITGKPVIDGTGTTGNANAIHAGDIASLEFSAFVQNFAAGTASWGVLFDNQNHFTERMVLDLDVTHCGNSPGNGGHVGFNVSGATTSTESFARLQGRIAVTPENNQRDGIVLMNGARIYDSPQLAVTGNWTSAGPVTSAAFLRLTGQVPAGHPGAGDFSKIDHSALYFTPEIDNLGAASPITIAFASAGNNTLLGCAGLMDFSQGGGSFANAVNFSTSFQFDGPIYGDLDLFRADSTGRVPFQLGNIASGATIDTLYNGLARAIPAAARTGLILSVGPISGDEFLAPRKFTLVNAAAFGSGFDMTFAAAATSHVSGGVAETVPAGTGASFQWSADDLLWYRI